MRKIQRKEEKTKLYFWIDYVVKQNYILHMINPIIIVNPWK